jgi:hypothetical protein
MTSIGKEGTMKGIRPLGLQLMSTYQQSLSNGGSAKDALAALKGPNSSATKSSSA